ncbi:MAG: enoyl-CoA hydratase/isomerase family protein [Terriglobia bacterium]
MNYETLLFSKREGIAFISINRPDKLNALNRTVLDDLEACLAAVRKDEDVRVVILGGAGDRAFAAGADITELSVLDAVQGKEASRRGQELFNQIENLGKPVIAAIRGYALGGGCELAMACTLRVASEDARLGQPEVKIGIIPGYGGSQRLRRLVGKGRAMEIILTGEPVSAEEAYRIGLVNRVVPVKDLMAEAESLARKIISNAPLAVEFAIESVNYGTAMTQQEAMLLEASLFGLSCATEDMKEGTRAFLERRPATFSGK